VKSFQHAVGITVDGKCVERCQKAIQKALGLDDPALPPGAPPVTHSTVLKLQQDLRSLGFPVPLDGKNGPLLVKAVQDFQHAYGLKPDGKCDQRCQLELAQQLSK